MYTVEKYETPRGGIISKMQFDWEQVENSLLHIFSKEQNGAAH